MVAFTPKGGCPLKLIPASATIWRTTSVAFTPKGGCPLKRQVGGCSLWGFCASSIHPQGWVLIETASSGTGAVIRLPCSIHPQGWVPIETRSSSRRPGGLALHVAFTPKGGCPLKLPSATINYPVPDLFSSIHPQGWVPIETPPLSDPFALVKTVAFTPKGGCPLKQLLPIAP